LSLPPGVRRTEIETSRGAFAALEALPGSGVPERCPALLVPGFTGSKEDYLAVLQSLARPGRRVVAIDMRGQYESDGPEEESAYTLGALAADIRALLEALGPEPAHLVGHSFGGLVTREAILDAGARPLSYTLMSSGPSAITGPRRRDAEALIDALPRVGIHRIWTEHMEPDARANGVPEEIIGFLRSRMLATSVTSLLTMAREILNAPDRVDELAKVCDEADLPLLVLYGENDNAWSPQIQAEMAERLGAAKVVIPGAAHSPAVEAPETTAGALCDFWRAAECRSAR